MTVIADVGVYFQKDAVFGGRCQKCELKLKWEVIREKDGTYFSADCCGLSYWLEPHTIKATVETRDG